MSLKENLFSEIKQKNLLLPVTGIILISVGVFLGSALNYSFLDRQTISQDKAAHNLVSVLEKQSGREYDIVSVTTENGLYNVNLVDQQSRLSTYYVTKNGNLVTDKMIEFRQLKNTVDAQSSFIDCLSDKDTVLYGNISQQETLVQIQILGGPNMVEPIYRDLENPSVLQEAVQRGLQRVPGLYYNGSVLSGVNRISAISEFTGCEYSGPK